MYELGDREFEYISREIYNYARINLTEKKRSLVISRLSKRVRALSLQGFAAYVDLLKHNDPGRSEFQRMVDALSTNYSLFFREAYHFEFLANEILPDFGAKALNIWSAACSTGQEIYSILITLLEFEKQSGRKLNYKLYASDISTDALRYAAAATYPARDIQKLDRGLASAYFLKGKGKKSESVKIKNEFVRKVSLFKLNLSDSVYRLPLMDIIFLRNVIIYFDKDTKADLISRLHGQIRPGGFLFLGHSESLSGIATGFAPVGKTIYKRIEQ